jgi:acyl-coenzyme A thioesterase PaaI-like protein
MTPNDRPPAGVAQESDLLAWVGSDFQSLPKTEGDVPLCGACRVPGRCRLGVTQEKLTEDDVVTSNLVCPPDHEGGPCVAHGGWTASVLDEILGHVPLWHNQLSVTATLTVDFRKPVPVDRPLQVRAWIDKIDGQKWYISGELVLAATKAVLATATGIWVARDVAHFARHQQWLAEQDAAASREGDDRG